MPSAKDGKPGTPVAPAAPAEVIEADVADPGVVDKVKATQIQTKKGKYGASKGPAFKPPQTAAEKKARKNYIEIELLDEEDVPIPGEYYEIVLPDGSVTSGTLDAKGFARVDGIDPGSCKVSFPNLDQDAVKAGGS